MVFLGVWEATKKKAIETVSSLLGLAITILLKTVVVTIFRQNVFRTFFRTRPSVSNIWTLALETWHLALSPGVIFSRTIQIVAATVIWIGRVDVPFLAPTVNLFGVYFFDNVPAHYAKDILTHEAHHHPYIERLAQLYLLRWHHGIDFGGRAGAVWRQLFVLALCPWLQKYRVYRQERTKQSLAELEQRRLTALEASKAQSRKSFRLRSTRRFDIDLNAL